MIINKKAKNVIPSNKKEIDARNTTRLKNKHGLTKNQLSKLEATDPKKYLEIGRWLYTYFKKELSDGTYDVINPVRYEKISEKNEYTPYIFRPVHLTKKRVLNKSDLTNLKISHNLRSDIMLFILVELGSLNSMDEIKRIASQVVGDEFAVIKLERAKNSSKLSHHLHILTSQPITRTLPEKIDAQYSVKPVEVGIGEYSKFSLETNLENILKYMSKSYDCRIYGDDDSDSLIYLLLQDWLSYNPKKAGSRNSPKRLWRINKTLDPLFSNHDKTEVVSNPSQTLEIHPPKYPKKVLKSLEIPEEKETPPLILLPLDQYVPVPSLSEYF
jgi:hypothetical protein